MSATVIKVHAAVGILSAGLAAALMWLLVTQPAHVAAAVGNHEYGALTLAVLHQFAGWLRALLRFL
jgi:hypothetical protein